MKIRVVLIALVLLFSVVSADPSVEDEQKCVDLNVMSTCPSGDDECQNALDKWEKEFAKNDKCQSAQSKLDKLKGSDTFPSLDFVKCYQDINKEKNSEIFNLYYYNPIVNCASNATPISKKSSDSQLTIDSVLSCEVKNADVCLVQKASLSFKADVADFDKYYKEKCSQQRSEFSALLNDKSYSSYYPFDVRSCNASISFVGQSEDFNKQRDCKMKCANPGNETSGNILVFSSLIVLLLCSLL
ncbi:hypothetical protein PPERSA_09389 [Pseudocohnilembus persalinus]|uniref:Transmembrane protein n=1 Tax=Pseudocohnilembus persalinus TaxID=266149 RepID=A0A0V0QL20_PSEPJ|nr:hypothetical protein PPERSA_09389 [Pseudocohnilembus persalinus]|eukprot:KRX02971.1 hypothetical protein PPERSA_09389 [Pseudocohnilembus persalinus]